MSIGAGGSSHQTLQAIFQERHLETGRVAIVRLRGRVDIESTDLFRRACREALSGARVLFDFSKLSFVGSTGLLAFLESLNELALRSDTDIRFMQVSSDFRRVLEATPLGHRPYYDDENMAIRGFDTISVLRAQEPSVNQGFGYLNLKRESHIEPGEAVPTTRIGDDGPDASLEDSVE
jgi:anti-anti-sigma factor